MELIRKAELYTDGSYNKSIPDLTRGGAVIIFNDKPYAFIKVTTNKKMYVSQWNVGGELLAAQIGLNMILNELQQFATQGIEVPLSMELYHDYIGIHDFVRPSAKTGKVWKANTESGLFYKEFYKEICNRYSTQINFNWIKSHSGNKWNEIVDMIAKGVYPDGYNDVIKKEVNF